MVCIDFALGAVFYLTAKTDRFLMDSKEAADDSTGGSGQHPDEPRRETSVTMGNTALGARFWFLIRQ